MDPPLWIAEHQRLSGLSGVWEPTQVLNEWSSWAYSLLSYENDPPCFQAFTSQGAAPIGAGPNSVPEVLRGQISVLMAYAPQIDENTDAEGWLYASCPSRMLVPRCAGRATKRSGDKFRRRWWQRGGIAPPALLTSPRGRAVGATVGAARGWKVLESFHASLDSVVGGRSLTRIPLDPYAYIRRASLAAARYEELVRRLPPWKDDVLALELCVASIYMRAAYGYTARAGMFDTVTSGAMVFSVHKATFDVGEHACDASSMRAFLDMTGLERQDVVCAMWKDGGPFRPAYAVCRDRQLRWLLVSIRGTISMRDMLTDAAARSVLFQEGRAHEGFLLSARWLLGELRETLRQELQRSPGYRLVLCGHSMGGSVAALAAAQLRAQDAWAVDAGCVAFGVGTPGSVSRCIAERLAREGVVFTVVCGQDWAPRYSLTNMNELIDNLCELGVMRTVSRKMAGNDVPAVPVLDPIEEQLTPGAILQIDVNAPRPRILAAFPQDYRHAMSTTPDVGAHIPLSAIEGLLRGCVDLLIERQRQVSEASFDFISGPSESASPLLSSSEDPRFASAPSAGEACSATAAQFVDSEFSISFPPAGCAPRSSARDEYPAVEGTSQSSASSAGDLRSRGEIELAPHGVPDVCEETRLKAVLSALRRIALDHENIYEAIPGLPAEQDTARRDVWDIFSKLKGFQKMQGPQA